MPDSIAVLTGITGFLAAHVALTFLEHGWTVRGTLRSEDKRAAVLAVPEYQPYIETGKMKLFVTGALETADYSEAFKGASVILHVASPVKFGDQEFRKTHLAPALDGTRRALEYAAKEPSVKSVVFTSTIGAHADFRKPPTELAGLVIDDASWNPHTLEDMDKLVAAADKNKGFYPDGFLFYLTSKKYAELEAWKVHKETGAPWPLATIAPVAIYGPAIQPMTSLSGGGASTEGPWRLLKGPKDAPILPTWLPQFVDVRDVAEAQYQAAVRGAQGRFLVSAGDQLRFPRDGGYGSRVVSSPQGPNRQRSAGPIRPYRSGRVRRTFRQCSEEARSQVSIEGTDFQGSDGPNFAIGGAGPQVIHSDDIACSRDDDRGFRGSADVYIMFSFEMMKRCTVQNRGFSSSTMHSVGGVEALGSFRRDYLYAVTFARLSTVDPTARVWMPKDSVPTKEGSSGIRRRTLNMDSHQPPTPAVQSTQSSSSRMNITDFTIRIPATGKGGDVGPEPGPSRWKTREFRFYYVIFALVVPMMIRIPARLSTATHHNYWTYAWRLSDGWLFGWKVDNSDPQYRSFRSNLPALLSLASAYLICSTVWSKLATPSPRSRTAFIATFALLMLGILHGTSIVKVLIILGANYRIAKLPKSGWVDRFWPGLMIAGNLLVLFLNERNDGYRFSHLHGAFEVLDQMDGLLPRWHINFNITMLRIVSFALDYHWRQSNPVGASLPEDHRQRVSMALPEEEYSLLNFIAYVLYPPLYIAGPIMTFNDFSWQIRKPTTITRRDQLSYGIRFVLCLLTMETVLHTMYVVAIKDSAAWEGDSPAEMSMIGFWNLVVVWLKLLIPWRYFRLWALLDGMEPPENMIRCVANNYSTLGFWRSWHRSYNLWVVRYLYIPVGGSKNVVAATILVFTFVALWHDLSFKLLAWGWLVSLFVLPEIVVKTAVPFDKYGHERWYRLLAGWGGVFNILLLMSANLVGFVLGLDGMRHLLHELTSSTSGVMFLFFSASCLYVAVQVMFEYREEERRRGIDRKC